MIDKNKARTVIKGIRESRRRSVSKSTRKRLKKLETKQYKELKIVTSSERFKKMIGFILVIKVSVKI